MECLNSELLRCRKHTDTLVCNNQSVTDVTAWFKGLCNILADVVLTITSYIKNIQSESHKNNVQTLLLYLTQITTVLSLLIQIFLIENERRDIIMEARRFIIKQLHWCIDGIELELPQKEAVIPEHESFHKLIDIALEKLGEIDVESSKDICLKEYYESRKQIEHALCYSMSVAQVTYEDDSKVIRGSCKSVLSELDSLLLEISKEHINVGLCNLSIDSCFDKFCSLERKVNCCVLKLTLKVFSHYLNPLDKLSECCFNRLGTNDELDDIIVEFDLHVDRIMQIGLFAVSSTSNINTITKIKNCLASLEALEGELVPQLTAVSNKNSGYIKNFASILVRHWKQQAENLKKLISAIIDPFAMCEVAYEEIKSHIDAICTSFAEERDLPKSILSDIVTESTVLISIITSSIQDISIDNLGKVEEIKENIRNVTHEIECAVDVLLIKNEPTRTGNERVIKRCKILKGLVKKLLLCLADDDNNVSLGNNCSSTSTYSDKVILPSEALNKSLEYITSRGKEIVNERSILYKSPKSTSEQLPNKINSTKPKSIKKPMPLSKLVHLRNMQFCNSSAMNNNSSLDLQITAILADLENLTALSGA